MKNNKTAAEIWKTTKEEFCVASARFAEIIKRVCDNYEKECGQTAMAWCVAEKTLFLLGADKDKLPCWNSHYLNETPMLGKIAFLRKSDNDDSASKSKHWPATASDYRIVTRQMNAVTPELALAGLRLEVEESL